MFNSPYFMFINCLALISLGVYFWLKGKGKIKNTHPDYIPSFGIFRVCGAIMAITGLTMMLFQLIRML